MRKKINLFLILLLALIFQFGSCKQPDDERVEIKEEWRNGVVFVNNEPGYFDFSRFGNGFFATENWIEKFDGKLIKAGVISVAAEPYTEKYYLVTYTIKDDPYEPIYEIPGVKYFYKVENYKAYVSIDDKEWDQLVISNVDLSKRKRGEYADIYASFFLKCKWFEGEYNLETEAE
jgi:transcription antitermination factor NusG